MQRIKNLFDDDSAVSPVIGVILMVAITVILAAVIASFVLGLGDNTDDVSPNIVFDTSAENESNTAQFVISVSQADADADPSTIYLRGNDSAVDGDWQSYEGNNLSAGDEAVIEYPGNLSQGDEVLVIFETDDTSDELDSFEVPEAP